MSLGFFGTLVPGTMVSMCSVDIRVSRIVFDVFCSLFVTLVSRALFGMSFLDSFTLVSCALFCMFFVDCLSRSCLAHCFVCVLFDCLVR